MPIFQCCSFYSCDKTKPCSVPSDVWLPWIKDVPWLYFTLLLWLPTMLSCICQETGWVLEETQCPSPALSIDHTVRGHLIKQLVLPANAASQVPVFFLFFFFFENFAAGNSGSPSSTKYQNRVSKTVFMPLNKDHPCEWEKSIIPFKKVISQSLLMNQLTKESCHQLDCSASFTKGESSKEEVKRELDWESGYLDFYSNFTATFKMHRKAFPSLLWQAVIMLWVWIGLARESIGWEIPKYTEFC